MLEIKTIQRMERPTWRVWDTLGRRIAEKPMLRLTVQDFEIAFLEEWDIISKKLIDHLISSLENRHATVLAV